MSKTDPKNQKEWIKFLKKQGWKEAKGGKHAKLMIHPSGKRVPLSHHSGNDYGKSLNHDIRKQVAEAEQAPERESEEERA